MDLSDIERICLGFPGSVRGEGSQFSMGLMIKGKHKGYCWTWNERIDPKKARVENRKVLAVRTPGLEAKEFLLNSNTDAIFTEDHYNGYPAVLIRLDEIAEDELTDILFEGHRTVLNSGPKPKSKKS